MEVLCFPTRMNLPLKLQKGLRFLAVVVLVSSYYSSAQAARFATVVTPLPNEDIASDCHYELAIPVLNHPVRAVWVIFDRGHDVHDLFGDTNVQAFARRYRLALLLHGHCPGKAPEDHEDMNMEPSKGLRRALFTALDQFAHNTRHSELAKAKLIFLGFSGAGSLSARLAASVPERTIAAILSAPGHNEPQGIDTLDLKAPALTIPELILVGGADTVSGTARPYQYFLKYRERGAPWIFVAQNKSPHCCTANARDLMLHWLKAVIQRRLAASYDDPLREMDQSNGWHAFLKTQENETKDSFGLRTFTVVGAEVEKSKRRVPNSMIVSGWLPSRALAREWQSFVRQPQHPILPLR